METKTNLKESTESNYRYLWEHYIQHEPIAEKALSKIHKSDVKLLYAKWLQEGFASNSLGKHQQSDPSGFGACCG